MVLGEGAMMSDDIAILDDRGLIYAFQDSKTKIVTPLHADISSNYRSHDKPTKLLGKVGNRKPLIDNHIVNIFENTKV